MIAVYARQSVDKKDSISIESQIKKCAGECNGEYTVYQDKGFSGKNINRPSFEKLMADVDAGRIKKIVVYRLDRFSRSIADFGQVWKRLQKGGVEFVSVNERFDTSTPMGRAMLHIIMVFAQLERETIAERVKDNYYDRAKKGSWVGGPAPFGFQIGRQLTAQGKTVPVLAENEDIEIVKRIFGLYARQNVSLGMIARTLTDEKIGGILKEAWDSIAISRILHNPVYVMCDADVYAYYKQKGLIFNHPVDAFTGEKGGMIVGKRDRNTGKYQNLENQYFSLANHRGVIPSKIWLQCQHKLEENRQVQNSGRGKYTWLSGLLKCGGCGYSLKIVKSKEKLYFVCSGHTNYHVCDKKTALSVQEIEQAAQTEIARILSQAKKDCMAEETSPHNNEIKIAIQKIEQKIDRLMQALTEGSGVTISYVNRELRQLDNRKKALEQSLEKETVKRQAFDVNFSQVDFEGQKIVAAKIIEKILVFEDSIEIVWKV